MECRDPEVQQVCYTDAAGVRSTLFAVIVFAANGAPHATYYTDAAGVVVDTSAGTVVVGACDCPKTFVEIVYDFSLDDNLCEPIELVKTIDCANVASVSYLDMDGAPYVPVGTIVPGCPCVLEAEPVINIATGWEQV